MIAITTPLDGFWSMHSSSFMGCTLNCILFLLLSSVSYFFSSKLYFDFQCYSTPALVHRVLLFKHTGVEKGKEMKMIH